MFLLPKTVTTGQIRFERIRVNIMIGADAIVKCLENEGVTTVYGYPGVAICPFYNSILDSKIRTILVRTEQNLSLIHI